MKRFWWVFIAMAGIGTSMWLVFFRSEPKKKVTGAIFPQEISVDRPATRNPELVAGKPDQEVVRESPRHSASEIEKHQAEHRRLLHLKRAVMDQEQKVEERRKVLATIVRTKGIIYKGQEADYSEQAEKPEEVVKKSLDAQDYVDSKREFETDQKLLQEMNLKLLSEKSVNESRGR